MKKWYICKYDYHHIQAPHLCSPVGVAYQKMQGDGPDCHGFIDMEAFSAWLQKKDLCAFSSGYEAAFGIKHGCEYPMMYSGQ